MGFGDFLKNVATAAIEGAEKLGEKILSIRKNGVITTQDVMTSN